MIIQKTKYELIKQKELGFRGNIYHFSQVHFYYNFNKVEGCGLTED